MSKTNYFQVLTGVITFYKLTKWTLRIGRKDSVIKCEIVKIVDNTISTLGSVLCTVLLRKKR